MRRRGVYVMPWIGLVLVLAIEPGAAGQRIDAERLLAERFRFTAAEVAQVRSGNPVAQLLPAKDSNEIGAVGAVRIAANPDRLVAWLKDIAAFRKAAELGIARRLSDPPAIGDFADLSLDADELAALRTCRAGACDLRLGDRAIQRFQSGVDWNAADSGRRANLLTRELMLGLAGAYRKGGDRELGAYHNEKTPRVAADEFQQVLRSSQTLLDISPALAAYLQGYPSAQLPESDQFLYWAKGGVGPEASITLHQLITYRPAGGTVLIADKQLYASRYVDASLTLVTLVPDPKGGAFYALVSSRGRSTMLEGVMARVLRGRVEKAMRETAVMYLGWIRNSMAL